MLRDVLEKQKAEEEEKEKQLVRVFHAVLIFMDSLMFCVLGIDSRAEAADKNSRHKRVKALLSRISAISVGDEAKRALPLANGAGKRAHPTRATAVDSYSFRFVSFGAFSVFCHRSVHGIYPAIFHQIFSGYAPEHVSRGF